MNLIAFLDGLAEPDPENAAARFLDRVAFFFLALMILSAPHSIAATQTAWLIGMLAWIARLIVRPRPKLRVGYVGIGLLVLFVWSVISAAFSYEPAISLDKLRAVAVLLIFFFVFNLLRNAKAVYFLAFLLIGSCMVNVTWTPIQKFMGQGVEVHSVLPHGLLGKLGVVDGDTLLRVNGRKIDSPDDITGTLFESKTVRLDVYRTDAPFTVELSNVNITGSETVNEMFGFATWNSSRNFRSSGFYGHYTTYAEVLQLIGALALGLFIAGFSLSIDRRLLILLGFCMAGIGFALLLTVTRASQLAFIISSIAIVFVGASRRVVLAAIVVAVPLSLIGLYVLQQNRQVGFFDPTDGSIRYRQMMWRDGARIVSESPRHMIFGVGMDSIKKNWREWGMYDNGFQPMGHFHSTPVQLAVERGLPALLIWFSILAIYARSLWRGLRSKSFSDWRARGILLGCFGGTIGFFASGLVHYNLGDTEVAMVFYTLMGLSMSLVENSKNDLLLIDSAFFKSMRRWQPNSLPGSLRKRSHS